MGACTIQEGGLKKLQCTPPVYSAPACRGSRRTQGQTAMPPFPRRDLQTSIRSSILPPHLLRPAKHQY